MHFHGTELDESPFLVLKMWSKTTSVIKLKLISNWSSTHMVNYSIREIFFFFLSPFVKSIFFYLRIHLINVHKIIYMYIYITTL